MGISVKGERNPSTERKVEWIKREETDLWCGLREVSGKPSLWTVLGSSLLRWVQFVIGKSAKLII